MEEEDAGEEIFVPEMPMRVEVGMYYYIVCEKCKCPSVSTSHSGDHARQLARKDLWAKVKGKTLCGECRGMGK
jgi:hypothetical protein